MTKIITKRAVSGTVRVATKTTRFCLARTADNVIEKDHTMSQEFTRILSLVLFFGNAHAVSSKTMSVIGASTDQ